MSRDLLLVVLSMTAWGVGEGLFFYFQPIYLQELGATPLQIGAILSVLGIIMTAAHIPAGYLSDRIGRRPLMWIAWTIGMTASWVMALAYSLPVFVAGYLLYSFTAFVMSPLNSYATAARGKLSVGRAITFISAAYNTGAIIGPLLGGLIGGRIGLRPIYLLSACIFVVSTVIIFFIRPQPVEAAASSHPRSQLPLSRLFVAFLGVVFVANFAMYLPQPLSQNFLQSERHITIEQIGQLGSIASLGIVFLNLTLGQITARRGFIFGQLATGLFALILWRGTGLGWYQLGYFFIGGYRVARSLLTAQTRSLVGQAAMGLAYGVTETVGASAIILAPLLAGWIYEQNPEWVYPTGLSLIVVSVLVSLVFVSRSRASHSIPLNPIIKEVEEC